MSAVSSVFDAFTNMSACVNAWSKYLIVAIVRYGLQYDGLHGRDVGELHLGYVQGTDYVGPACKTTDGEPQGLHTEQLAPSIDAPSYSEETVLFGGSGTQCCDILWLYFMVLKVFGGRPFNGHMHTNVYTHMLQEESISTNMKLNF